MKIALISRHDYCGSGYRLAEAINQTTKNHVQYFRLVPDGMSFGRPPTVFRFQNDTWVIGKHDVAELDELLAGVDILHFKGDEPPTEKYFPLINITGKPRVVSVSGMYFRRGFDLVSQPLEDMEVYLEETDKRTAMMADLNYPEFDAQFTPHPHDVKNTPYTWKPRKKPLIVHTPTSRAKKGTEVFLKAVEGLNVDVEIIEGESHEKSLKAISGATLFFDQCVQKAYGNATIEAMARGIPVLTNLPISSVKQAQGLFNDTPIVHTGETIKSVREAIVGVLGRDLKALSLETRAFCEKVHGYEAVGKMWDNIYKGMLKSNKS